MKTSIITLTLTAIVAGFGSIDSAEAGHKQITHKRAVTHKHVSKKTFGGGRKVVVHKDVKKVVHVKQVNKVVSHGYLGSPAWDFPAYSYANSYGYGGSYGSISAIGSFGGFSFGFGAPAIHPLAPSYLYNQVWVEPITETIVVGSDAFGNPIYQTVVVTPGAYRTASYMLLEDGSREFVAYLP